MRATTIRFCLLWQTSLSKRNKEMYVKRQRELLHLIQPYNKLVGICGPSGIKKPRILRMDICLYADEIAKHERKLKSYLLRTTGRPEWLTFELLRLVNDSKCRQQNFCSEKLKSDAHYSHCSPIIKLNISKHTQTNVVLSVVSHDVVGLKYRFPLKWTELNCHQFTDLRFRKTCRV